MRKFLSMLIVLSLSFSLAACGNSNNADAAGSTSQAFQAATEESNSTEAEENETTSEEQNTEESENTEQTEDSDIESTTILVAYFSRTGENYNVGYIEKGNTHIVADMIAEQTGGDTFEISTVTPYPDDYDECTDIARQEQSENARPELAASVEGMENYDTIFLGYPIWWSDMPMAVYTFLESYDFSGKTIIPFSTHEGSGLASTESSIAKICPDSEILEGLSIRGAVAQNSQDEAQESVTNWLQELGFIE